MHIIASSYTSHFSFKKENANLAKLGFVALDITGKNYLTWVVDAKIHLEVGNLRETIKDENNASS